jgi:hypothetical protein
VTPIVLPAPPSVMPPLVSDPAAVETCGTRLRAACARFDDLGTFVAGPARLADWSGSASGAYHQAIAPLGDDADALSLGLRRVATRVLEHAEKLTRLRARHDTLAGTSTSLAGGIEVLRRDVDAASRAGTPGLAPVLQARADTLARSITSYEGDRDRWVLDLAVEEREVVAVLDRLLTLRTVVRRFGGAPDPADGALATLPPSGASPAAVRAWWAGLGHAARTALLVAAPGAIGNLAGIPARARHRANTVRLERDLADLRARRDSGSLREDERRVLRSAEAARVALDDVAGLLDPRTGEEVPVLLYLYDPSAFDGDGAVAVSVGDPDRADDVSLLVPGMGTDAAEVPDRVQDVVALYEAARTEDATASHASLAWLGYDAPDNVPILDGLSGDVGGVLGEAMAERGGEHLASAVEGLRAERLRAPADLTVIGHSYGSTTAGAAAHDRGLAVDDLVVLGSPGLGRDVDHVADLGLTREQVWVGAASRDPVAGLAGHGAVHLGTFGLGLGRDPAEDVFGATRFTAESPERGSLDSFADHSRYLDPGSESLRNLAEIVTGHPADVEVARPVVDPWWRGPVDPEHGRPPAPQGRGGGVT